MEINEILNSAVSEMTGEDLRRAQEIIEANKEKQFIQRAIDIGEGSENFPRVYNLDGSISTHSMASGEAEGKYYAYPTVMENEQGELQRYEEDAFRRAIDKGDFIPFETEEEADWFSRNYKAGWPKQHK